MNRIAASKCTACVRALSLLGAVLLGSCLVEPPLRSSHAPDEWTLNHWLLSRLSLHRDRVPPLRALPRDASDEEVIAAVQALYASVADPYTRYIPPAQASVAETLLVSTHVPGSVGWELHTHAECGETPLRVRHVFPRGPAEDAGVRKGDCLVSLQNNLLQGDSAEQLLMALSDTLAILELELRRGQEQWRVALPKRSVLAPSILADTLSGVQVLSMRRFVERSWSDSGTVGEFFHFLQGPGLPTVLDLRWNPGGQLEQCLGVADALLDSGVLVHLQMQWFDGAGEPAVETMQINASAGRKVGERRFVALINGSTASCAEILVSVLRDRLDVPIVGQRSYGKGIGQGFWRTPAGGLAILTSSRFLSPDGESYDGVGIEPDYTEAPQWALARALELAQGTPLPPAKRGAYIEGDFDSARPRAEVGLLGGAWSRRWEKVSFAEEVFP